MQRYVLLGLVLILIFLGIAASWWLTRPPQEGSLTITLDKEFYPQGDTMEITLKNGLYETISWNYLLFDKWDGTAWQDYVIRIPQGESLEPSGAALVTYKLEVFSSGKYRTRFHGWTGSLDTLKWAPSVYAEFEVTAPPAENRIIITLDKEIYQPCDNIVITLQNLSGEPVWFSHGSYGLFFEKWNENTWKPYEGIPGDSVMTSLEPHGQAVVTWELETWREEGGTLKWGCFHPGKYRVVTAGAMGKISSEIVLKAFAEFEIQG